MRFAIIITVLLSLSAFATSPNNTPGLQQKGVILLPNGWKIQPAGRHITVDDLPLEMVESKDGNYLIVTNNGYSPPVLTVVDMRRFYALDRIKVKNAWLGLAFSQDGSLLYSSTGGDGGIQSFEFSKGRLKEKGNIKLTRPTSTSFVGGIAVHSDQKRLFAVQILGNVLNEIDIASEKTLRTLQLEAEPYTTLLSADGKSLFISLWGGAKIVEVSTDTLQIVRSFQTGEHPNSMKLSSDGALLYVACANTNSVWVIDLKAGKAIEQISVSLYPQAPMGSTPSGLGLSADESTLLVTNSDNNTVAVVDVSKVGAGKVRGFIPTGWYPTAARFTQDGKKILILSGKGLTSVPNPRGGEVPNYIGQMLLGTLSMLDIPDAEQLEEYTKIVYALTPYSDKIRLTPARAPEKSPIPAKVGDPSPIKYVFYILRENRTYDQILGDMKEGNGDPYLCLFGEDVTPNAHAIAREFVLLDNFYVDAEVSADGHAFSMGAYATDFIEKTWPMNYAGRGADYITEGKGPQRNPYGNIAAPPSGYLWDAAKRAGVSVRSYGIFAHRGAVDEEDSRKGKVDAFVPGLKGLIHPEYPPYDLSVPDNKRIDVWLEEFRKFEKEGGLPRLSLIQLPNDHTASTYPGYPTPRAMVAENDLALGRLVEEISKSKFWKESAIFVLEDDAQDGPDHVDSHRSVGLIISPYIRRGTVDSTMYTTSGFLRTMELILGLEPLTQYDAAATPAYAAFQKTPDTRPYTPRPARISLTEKNGPDAYGATESMSMNLKDVDRAPMREMNEILWKSIRGSDSVMPPPVRSAFIQPVENEEDED
ncbi:MAG TPA: alkaline phosphatase family protein [Acidobacteriota bacterium]|nr:alkaline phosphatase family protein [Acidobacteriota bacterium]